VRTRATTAIAVLAAALLTLSACSSSDGAGAADKPAATTTATGFDCNAPDLSDADKVANCTGPDNGKSLQQAFGEVYAWPDGVKVTITEAKVFTGYDKELLESPTAGGVDYQVMVKVTNSGKVPFDLGGLSVITEGATNGGEASIASWSHGAPGLEGRIAPGVTVIKADSETLEGQFGRKIVVTVQRMNPDNSGVMDFPEFTGSITD
jgi:hypothetical protein